MHKNFELVVHYCTTFCYRMSRCC